jgi:hypothetical protein
MGMWARMAWSAITGASLVLACSEFTAPEPTKLGSTPAPDAEQTFDTDAGADSGKQSPDANIAPGGECVNSDNVFCDDFEGDGGFSKWSGNSAECVGCSIESAPASSPARGRVAKFKATSTGIVRVYHEFRQKSFALSAQVYLESAPTGEFALFYIEYRQNVDGECEPLKNCTIVEIKLTTNPTGYTSVNIVQSGVGVGPAKTSGDGLLIDTGRWYAISFSIDATSATDPTALVKIEGMPPANLKLAKQFGQLTLALVGVVGSNRESGAAPRTVLVDNVRIRKLLN